MIPTQDINAQIELVESFISECSFSNRLISLGSDAILTNNAEIAVSNVYMSNDGTKKNGRVRVIVSGILAVENVPDASCDYKMTVEGTFSTDKETNDEKFLELLWVNGSAVLYSITRAKMEVLSATVFEVGKITLPLINMVEFIKKQNAAYLKAHSDNG